MKIVCVSHYYTPHVGGLEIVAEMQVRSLRDKGHDVSVITCAASGEKSESIEENGFNFERVRAINFFDIHFSIPFPIGGFGLLRALWKHIGACDVVHIHDVFYQTSWLAYLCARVRSKPVVLTQHVGVVEHTNQLVMCIQRSVYATFGKSIFSYARKIIAYNPYVRDYLIEQGVEPAKIQHLQNGIDTNLFTPSDFKDKAAKRKVFGLPLDRPLVLFVGRFVPKKGFDVLYQAADDDYDLVFVGSGEVPKVWHKDPRIHFLGALSQAQLVSLYQAVDVFVFPAKGEIFTLVMQEAMASGLPVIASREKEYAEYTIDEERFLFCIPTPDELKASIRKVVSDEDLRKQMGAYSLELSQRLFSWERNVESLINVYQDITHTKKQSVVTTSWDDGHMLDKKLATVLKQYGVKGTFYVAPYDREFESKALLTIEEIKQLAHDFEVGAHTMTHRHLTTLSLNEAEKEIKDSKQFLEDIVGVPVESFCYPAGKYNKEHAALVHQAGFSSARTVKRYAFNLGVSPFETPTSIHTYNHWSDAWHLLIFVRFNPIAFLRYYRNWDMQAMAMFDHVHTHGGIFHLWGHSWEIEAHNDWERLERVLKHIGGRDTVAYVTNKESYGYAT